MRYYKCQKCGYCFKIKQSHYEMMEARSIDKKAHVKCSACSSEHLTRSNKSEWCKEKGLQTMIEKNKRDYSKP